jgi:exopolysaccharide biosynthesis polyprenyl glycosylphosphotransferase
VNACFLIISVVLDLVMITLAMFSAYYIRFTWGLIPVTLGVPPLSNYVPVIPLIMVVWAFAYRYNELYANWGRRRGIDELFAIVGAAVITVLVVLALVFFYRGFSYSRIVLLIFGFLLVLFVSFNRIILLLITRLLWRSGKGLKRAVVAGGGEIARVLVKKLIGKDGNGYHLLGLASTDGDAEIKDLQEWSSRELKVDLKYLGELSSLDRWVKALAVDTVFVAGEVERNEIVRILPQAEKLRVDLKLVPDILGIMRTKVVADSRFGLPLFSLRRLPMNWWGRIFKRIMDLLLALIAIILFFPFGVVIALIIKLTSKGSVFYTQERVGLDGRTFKIYKFRTMRQDAESASGPVWAGKDDPRRTPIGRFLRKASLDEIPQFLNVLVGQMSVVGPRPERPYFVQKFSSQVPRYLERHRLKSGITGWAQVNGLRGDTSLEDRIEYDIYYIENWSLIFDLKIIILTVFNLFSPEKAGKRG